MLLFINNLGPIAHRFRDMATYSLYILFYSALWPFKEIQGH